MLIDTSDPLWPRISAAFSGLNPVHPYLTDDQYTQSCIMQYIVSVVKQFEGQAAIQQVQDKVDVDFAAIVPKPVLPAPETVIS
jgi:hypothetical protein